MYLRNVSEKKVIRIAHEEAEAVFAGSEKKQEDLIEYLEIAFPNSSGIFQDKKTFRLSDAKNLWLWFRLTRSIVKKIETYGLPDLDIAIKFGR